VSAADAYDHRESLAAIAGPTAVGKSEIALCLAELLNGEIISVDSMQVYRGMDIGTAKPSITDRARVPHHLIDVVDVATEFNVAQFVTLTRQAITDIRRRGRVPVLCGGTGLYFKALLHGLGPAPAGNLSLRAVLEGTPLPELLAELASSDPVTYERIDKHNLRRVVRALEVIRVTGKPYSEQRADWSRQSDTNHFMVFGIIRDPAELRERIDERVDWMFASGLVAETRLLLERGLAKNHTAMQALGYRQVVEHLNGARSLPETVALVKTRTRQFAKRQMTWFRRQLPLHWIQPGSGDAPSRIALEIAKALAPSVPGPSSRN